MNARQSAENDPPACALFEGLKSGPCVVCGYSYEDHRPATRVRVIPPGVDQ